MSGKDGPRQDVIGGSVIVDQDETPEVIAQIKADIKADLESRWTGPAKWRWWDSADWDGKPRTIGCSVSHPDRPFPYH